MERLVERKKEGRMASKWRSQNTHINQLSSLSYLGAVCDAPEQLQYKDHWLHITITNVMIMKILKY